MSSKQGAGLPALALMAALVLGGAGWAEAVCPAGFVETATECQLLGDITLTGTTAFTKTVHLFGGSSITAQDATGFTLLINPGDFIMEANSELDGDQAGWLEVKAVLAQRVDPALVVAGVLPGLARVELGHPGWPAVPFENLRTVKTAAFYD
jgi:hypothetical protein